MLPHKISIRFERMISYLNEGGSVSYFSFKSPDLIAFNLRNKVCIRSRYIDRS